MSRGRPSPYVLLTWESGVCATNEEGSSTAARMAGIATYLIGFLPQSGQRKRVPLRDRCSFGRFPWLISQALSVTYMAGERRLYLERNCRLPESPAHSRRRNREGPASSKGLNSQRGFGPAVEPRRKSRPRSTSLHGSSPCKCQRLSTLRWDRLPPSRPSTKSGARAGGRRLSDRRLHRWLAGTSASAPSSHGAADLLGLNRAHICVRNQKALGPVDGRPASAYRTYSKSRSPVGDRWGRDPSQRMLHVVPSPSSTRVRAP